MTRVGPWALMFLLAVVLPMSAVAAPGYDLFETDPKTTDLKFEGDAELESGFFGRGSDPFAGVVRLGGVPLEKFRKKRIGDADTVIRRDGGAVVGTSRIELVRLSLHSMKPITVTYGAVGRGATQSNGNGGVRKERWTVEVSPSPNATSEGTITIEESNTFTSKLLVVPLLTFRRIPDGKKRTMDFGPLAPLLEEALTFKPNRPAPWRRSCAPPALAVPGLNGGFCPGLTPDGEKALTIEEAAFARHGVLPVQPALDHFQCYREAKSSFRPRSVELEDQFGKRKAWISHRAELCNPVRKNGQPYQNKAAHLQCYVTKARSAERTVIVQNQFGSQRLRVKPPSRLCVPSEKRVRRAGRWSSFAPIRTPIDHFQCYKVEPRSSLWAVHRVKGVRLRDQFGKRGTTIGRAFQLCAPTEKRWKETTTPREHSVKHLVCYWTGKKKRRRMVEIRNQFERRKLAVRKATSLCVPSNKLVVR